MNNNNNVKFVFVGSLMKGSSGLVLGRCEYYNWFTGLMDEVRNLICISFAS